MAKKSGASIDMCGNAIAMGGGAVTGASAVSGNTTGNDWSLGGGALSMQLGGTVQPFLLQPAASASGTGATEPKMSWRGVGGADVSFRGNSEGVECTGNVSAEGAYLYGGMVFDAMRDLRRPWRSCDFFGYLAPDLLPFTPAALAGGAIVALSSSNGLVGFKSAASAGSSGHCVTLERATSLTIGGGEVFVAVFKPYQLTSNSTPNFALGFHDIQSASLNATDGVYVYATMSGTSGILYARCVAGGTATTAALATLTYDQSYRIVIEVNATASSASFRLFDASAAVIASGAITTNIPGATNYLGVGAVAFSSTVPTVASALFYLDYMGFGQGALRALTR